METFDKLINSNANFKDRSDLEPKFATGEIPEQADFYALIHNSLSRKEDGIYKAPNTGLCIKAAGDDKNVLLFYEDEKSESAWRVGTKNGLNFISNGNSTLSLKQDGRIGINNPDPLSDFQIGKEWTFINRKDSFECFIGYNSYYGKDNKIREITLLNGASAIAFKSGVIDFYLKKHNLLVPDFKRSLRIGFDDIAAESMTIHSKSLFLTQSLKFKDSQDNFKNEFSIRRSSISKDRLEISLGNETLTGAFPELNLPPQIIIPKYTFVIGHSPYSRSGILLDATPQFSVNQDGDAYVRNKLGINTSAKDKLHVKGIVRIENNAETLRLVGGDHCYIEFYPKGFDETSNDRAYRFNRRAWLGYRDKDAVDLIINNKDGEVKLEGLSDKRAKKNIVNAVGILPKIMSIQPIYYNYIKDSEKTLPRLGVVAQQIISVFPEIVSINKDDKSKKMMFVDYSRFGIMAIQAIRELKFELDQLKTQLNQAKV